MSACESLTTGGGDDKVDTNSFELVMAEADYNEQDETDPNELLEYDLWEGQFSLSGTAADQAAGDQVGVAKAIKNARNQQKMYQICSSDTKTGLKRCRLTK